jgi:endo-1,4-beta-xylanase
MKKAKRRILAMFMAMAMTVAAIPTHSSNARTMTSNFINNSSQRINGFDFEAWTDDRGAVGIEMTVNPNGSYSGAWNQTYNTLFRAGRRFNPLPAVSSIGNVSLNYNVTEFTSNGGATYLCVYGWTRGPLIEWYIVDRWIDWTPASGSGVGTAANGYTHHGTLEANGGVYDIITGWRVNQPSIDGNQTFLQIFSVRRGSAGQRNQPNATSGTIDISAHFAAWNNIPEQTAPNGTRSRFNSATANLYEISFTVEGFGGDNFSTGRGTVERLCIRYGTNRVCTQSGCSHCDGTIAPPVCGVDGFECGTCATCNPPPPECTCPADRPMTKIHEWRQLFTIEDIADINAGIMTRIALQRAGEAAAAIPVYSEAFVNNGIGISVSGRTQSWHSLDVLLGSYVNNPNGRYRITVEGSSTSPLQLQFPLEDAPWEYGTVTGTTTGVTMDFTGAPVEGQNLHRIRIRTGDTADYTVSNIIIEQFPPCCGACHVACTCAEQTPAPLYRVEREVVRELCADCNTEKSWAMTRLISIETDAVLLVRRVSFPLKLRALEMNHCPNSRNWESFAEVPASNPAAAVIG